MLTPDKPLSTWQMFWKIWKIALPAMISLFFQFFAEAVNTYYVGNLNDTFMLAGIGLGNMTINIFCFAVFMGLNGAIETLVSQAYGSKNYYLCGVYLNRGRIIVACSFIPTSILLLNCKSILIGLGQHEMTSHYALLYIQTILPGLFFQAQFDAVRRFLNSMNYSVIPMIT